MTSLVVLVLLLAVTYAAAMLDKTYRRSYSIAFLVLLCALCGERYRAEQNVASRAIEQLVAKQKIIDAEPVEMLVGSINFRSAYERGREQWFAKQKNRTATKRSKR